MQLEEIRKTVSAYEAQKINIGLFLPLCENIVSRMIESSIDVSFIGASLLEYKDITKELNKNDALTAFIGTLEKRIVLEMKYQEDANKISLLNNKAIIVSNYYNLVSQCKSLNSNNIIMDLLLNLT